MYDTQIYTDILYTTANKDILYTDIHYINKCTTAKKDISLWLIEL